MIRLLEFDAFLVGTGYPTRKISNADMSMCMILYLRANVDKLTDIFFLMILLDVYIYTHTLPSLSEDTWRQTRRCKDIVTFQCAPTF